MGRRNGTGAAAGVAVAALILTACTSSQAGTPPPTMSPDPTTTGTAPTSPGSPEPAASELVAEVWEAVHAARIEELSSTEPPDLTRFDGLVTDAGRDALDALIRAGRSEVAATVVEVETWPRVEVDAGQDEATVDDCILVGQTATDGETDEPTVRSQVWTGRLVRSDDDWLVDELAPREPDCVPAELQRQLVDTYLAWHDAKNTWWDPPDPEHPSLERVMVAPGLDDMRALLAEHAEMGIVVRDDHDPVNAVVTELGVGTAQVTDCFPAYPDNLGAYDPETGERREDLSPLPTEGQLDQVVVSLRRSEDGVWKVSGWRSTSKNDCTPGGTTYVVAP